MVNIDNITSVISKMKKLDINDPVIEEYWDQLNKEFTNESDSIQFLNRCTEEEAYWVSSIFDDLAHKFQSKKYVECLKGLEKKFPKLVISHDIKIAESYIS